MVAAAGDVLMGAGVATGSTAIFGAGQSVAGAGAALGSAIFGAAVAASDDVAGAAATRAGPSASTKVTNLPETKGQSVPQGQAVDKWNKFLGPGAQTDIHPRLGTSDPNRVVTQTSSNTWRSIRFGPHEMNSSPTKFHYHEETWSYDADADTMTVANNLVRMH